MLMNRTTPFMVPVDDANPAIIKNEALCSECGHCFAVCEEEIGVAAKYLLNQREAYQCIGCGQCSASCPEKAITGRPHYKIVKELIQDPEKSLFFRLRHLSELVLRTVLGKSREHLHKMRW